jgi:hypothetical protein
MEDDRFSSIVGFLPIRESSMIPKIGGITPTPIIIVMVIAIITRIRKIEGIIWTLAGNIPKIVTQCAFVFEVRTWGTVRT